MSKISHAILPGLGQVCPECLSRGHIAEFPLSVGEVYSFDITEPPSRLDWDIAAARTLITARPRTAQRLSPTWLAAWLAQWTSITPEHLEHIPADRRDEPGILVEILVCIPGGRPEPFRVLIDGTHRAARKLRDSQDVWTYLLTEQEQRSICTYYVNGQMTELSSFAGPGVTPEQAGL
jgi:hypothetical protein